MIKRVIPARYTLIFGVSFIVLLIALQIALFSMLQTKAYQSRNWISHTAAVLTEVNTLMSKIKDAELSERAYLLTGDVKLLRLFYLGTGELQTDPQADRSGITDFRSIAEVLRDIDNLTSDNTEQQDRLKTLRDLVAQKIDFSRTNIRTRAATAPDSGPEATAIGLGFQAMRQIRRVVTSISQAEQDLYGQRTADGRSTESNLTYFIGVAAFITYAAIFSLITLIFRNLTRSQRITEELSRKESYFRAAAEGGLAAFFIFRRRLDGSSNRPDLILEYLNPLGEEMMGSRLAALQNEPINAVMPVVHGIEGETDDLYQTAVHQQRAQEREYLVTNGPFAGRYLQEQIIPLPSGVAVSCRDITDRKHIDSMKNEFVSTVSHELRTPLTAIRGSLGLIVGGIAGEISTEAKGMLNIAYNNCERLVRLINDILDIEKIEAGRMIFDRRPLAILAFLRQAMEANAAFADRYGVSILLDEHIGGSVDETTQVHADFDRLMQVATNLISNAIKFSRRGGNVTLSCTIVQGKVQVEVRDSGIGIPRRFHSQIFQKFAQADGSDTRQKSGTGLGLSIVKSIIEEMEGSVYFESEEDIGTSFFFTLPIISPAQEQTATAFANIVDGGERRVLICEDEVDIANLLRMILEREGIHADMAADATTAMSLLEQRSYSALILDLILPDKCGISLIRDIRSSTKFGNLPIVVVSAKAESGRRLLKGDAVSIVDWMSKPIDADRLVATIQKLRRLDGSSKILHVEDDKDLADVLKLSLVGVAETAWVPTLREAREQLAERHFDLVVLDIGLPDGSGFDLLPLFGSGGQYPTPVILFTAGEVPADVSQGVAAALIKSKTSESKLLHTIKQLVCDGELQHRTSEG